MMNKEELNIILMSNSNKKAKERALIDYFVEKLLKYKDSVECEHSEDNKVYFGIKTSIRRQFESEFSGYVEEFSSGYSSLVDIVEIKGEEWLYYSYFACYDFNAFAGINNSKCFCDALETLGWIER